jgi:hypothetical protein
LRERRHPKLHRESVSFSILYVDGDSAERSLDLVCKARCQGAVRWRCQEGWMVCNSHAALCDNHADFCAQDEEQLQLWFHGVRAAVMKLKSVVPPGSTVAAQMQAAARAAGAAQRWKVVRAH